MEVRSHESVQINIDESTEEKQTTYPEPRSPPSLPSWFRALADRLLTRFHNAPPPTNRPQRELVAEEATQSFDTKYDCFCTALAWIILLIAIIAFGLFSLAYFLTESDTKAHDYFLELAAATFLTFCVGTSFKFAHGVIREHKFPKPLLRDLYLRVSRHG
eukprot:TRINITY_DN16371_c0_g1_i1.p1 TRINITY_DN16371_c0_g1~~TRINITY_DN16371_c0_g1_i1.p1  ORF type:complete len:160 (-),score=12.78 TRINITY_DN16371_c0_g1_i1:461-940(-)